MIEQIFLLPQVKRSVISSKKLVRLASRVGKQLDLKKLRKGQENLKTL